MNWSLRRPNISLRVTTFVPVIAPAHEPKPIAGLSPLARALWRDKRERETRKVKLNSRS